MAGVEHDIVAYRIYQSNHEINFQGKKTQTAAQIVCYSAAAGRSKDRVVVLVFCDPQNVLNNHKLANGLFRAFIPWDKYTWYVDLLRNEGPHKIDIRDDMTFFLRTLDAEQAGEWDID